MWKGIQDFFQFDRREQIAIVILLSLIATGMGIQAYRAFHGVKTDFDQAAFQAAVKQIQAVQDSLAAVGRAKAESQLAMAPAVAPVPKKITDGQININTATVRDLARLPRIGTRTAERIIEFREQNGVFHSIEDIQKVQGIGEKTFEKIKPFIIIN
jgi:competence protein ComEA